MNIQIENGIDRNTCDQLRTALKELLAPIESTGLSVEVGNIKYSSVNMKVSMEFFVKEGKEEQDKEMANRWLEATDAQFRVGDEFSDPGGTYVIKGYNSKARKFPVIIHNKEDGKDYKIDVHRVNQTIALNKIREQAKGQ